MEPDSTRFISRISDSLLKMLQIAEENTVKSNLLDKIIRGCGQCGMDVGSLDKNNEDYRTVLHTLLNCIPTNSLNWEQLEQLVLKVESFEERMREENVLKKQTKTKKKKSGKNKNGHTGTC